MSDPRTLTLRECAHLLVEAWPEEKLAELELVLIRFRIEVLEREIEGAKP
jgi:hypothetical protein